MSDSRFAEKAASAFVEWRRLNYGKGPWKHLTIKKEHLQDDLASPVKPESCRVAISDSQLYSRTLSDLQRWCADYRNGYRENTADQIKPLQEESSRPKRLPPTSELLAGLERYMTGTVLERDEPEVTTEFDDTSSFEGRIIKADPTDPSVLDATKIAILDLIQSDYNHAPDKRLSLVAVLKVNAESLGPDLHGFNYYITLKAKSKSEGEATYQAKVFYSHRGSGLLRLFRRVACESDPNGSASTSSHASSSVKRQAEEINLTWKKQKRAVADRASPCCW